MSRKTSIRKIKRLINERLAKRHLSNREDKFGKFPTYKRGNKILVSYTGLNRLSHFKLAALHIALLASKNIDVLDVLQRTSKGVERINFYLPEQTP